ncbi:MAG: radical SAM protein [Armatimonadetes bacterium]|nr:radical SAM protein [Armatimonadota bacterium]
MSDKQTEQSTAPFEGSLSVGIGLTNDCNLNCEHCYRPTGSVYRLSLDDVRAVCERLPVGSIGMGTGENALHPQFVEIVDYLLNRGIKLSIASNGYSLNSIPDECLKAFHDVEVSVDFPTEEEQDRFRGTGNWRDIHAAVERCTAMGIEVSILATLMSTNYDKMDGLARLARSLGCNLRVNVYQPVRADRFRLSYEQFWEGYRRLFGSSLLVSCSEPVVCSVIGLGPAVSPCGLRSVRITPERHIAPCVYWPENMLTIDDLKRLGRDVLRSPQFERARAIPPSTGDCPCQGGCASRRALSGNLDAHDDYCPWVRGDKIELSVELAPQKHLTRSQNVCTTIVI